MNLDLYTYNCVDLQRLLLSFQILEVKLNHELKSMNKRWTALPTAEMLVYVFQGNSRHLINACFLFVTLSLVFWIVSKLQRHSVREVNLHAFYKSRRSWSTQFDGLLAINLPIWTTDILKALIDNFVVLSGSTMTTLYSFRKTCHHKWKGHKNKKIDRTRRLQ